MRPALFYICPPDAQKVLRSVIAGMVVATLISFASGARAQQKTVQPTAPVRVTGCSGGIASLELIEFAAYDVTFRNGAPSAADEVRLTIRPRRKKALSFDLKGTFEPQVEVKRRVERSVGFGLYSYSSADNDCAVEYVHFVDGTSWTRS